MTTRTTSRQRRVSAQHRIRGRAHRWDEFQVGKLTLRGVAFYPGWDADMETFVEGNYLVCDAEAVAQLRR